jgi:hypothetical protein
MVLDPKAAVACAVRSFLERGQISFARPLLHKTGTRAEGRARDSSGTLIGNGIILQVAGAIG